jgi:hypothetical protein
MPLVAQGVREQTFINPAYFKEDFSVDSFLLQLTRDVIEARVDGSTPAPSSSDTAAAAAAAARNTVDRVQRLIRRFMQAEHEISALAQDVGLKLGELQVAAAHDEATYKARAHTHTHIRAHVQV